MWVGLFLGFTGFFIWSFFSKRFAGYVALVLFMNIFLPGLVQFPFSGADLNASSFNDATLLRLRESLSDAYEIFFIGSISVLIGILICGKKLFFRGIFEWIGGSSNRATSNVLLLLSAISLLILFMLFFLFGFNSFSNLREGALMTPMLRPFFNLFGAALPVVLCFSVLAALERRAVDAIIIAGFLFGLGAISGSRGTVIQGVVLSIPAFFIARQYGFGMSLLRRGVLLGGGVCFFLFILYLGDVRNGGFNPLLTLVRIDDALFYGNNLSDVRDFAYILSYWEGKYSLGLGYLDGFLSFLPSGWFEFRNSLRSIDMMAGVMDFAGEGHAGLRVTMFGGNFLNFGYIGVVVMGFVFGFATKLIGNWCEYFSSQKRPAAYVVGCFLLGHILSAFYYLGSFFQVYVTLLILVVARVFVKPRQLN